MLRSCGFVRFAILSLLSATAIVLSGAAHYVRASEPWLVPDPVEATDVPPPHDATVGTLAGEADTVGGAATYSVPIVVPPGRAGMQPALSIEYNSRAGNGVAGVGWSISGGSSIHRCPQTPEQDAATAGVSFGNNDRLCLDGQRLVKIGAGAYGANGSEYRTEIDSYARITQAGGDLVGASTCFRVEHKDGRILHYGAITAGSPLPTGCAASSANARLRPNGSSAPLGWLVERIEDRVGNYQSYAYVDYGYGENLLRKVTYTGFGTDPGDRAVTFNYVQRTVAATGATDVASSVLAGATSMQTRALSSIVTTVGGSTVRTYSLAYATSVYSGRLLLTSLEECATDSSGTVCHDPTTFSFNDRPLHFPLTSLSGMFLPGSGETENPYQVYMLNDFDGDGTREAGVTAKLSSGIHKYLVQLTADRSVHNALDLTGTSFNLGRSAQIDVDGSGRAVQVVAPSSPGVVSFNVWNLALFPRGSIATSNPFMSVNSNISHSPTPVPLGQREIVHAADINGDGRTDLAIVKPTSSCGTDSLGQKDGVFVHVNDMTAPLASGQTAQFVPLNAAPSTPLFCLPRTLNTSGPNITYVEAAIDHVADFDGNGLPDFFLVNGGSAPGRSDFAGIALTTRSGSPIAASIRSCTQIGLVDSATSTDDCHWSRGYVTRWMDVNGDGLEDFVIARAAASPGGTWHLRLNRGNGTLGADINTGSSEGLAADHLGGEFPYAFRYAGKLPAMDVDSDGKPDLLMPSRTQGMGGIAMKVCTLTKVPKLQDGDTFQCPIAAGAQFQSPVGAQVCAAYSCSPNVDGSATLPSNPGPPGRPYPYQWNNLPAFLSYNTDARHEGQGADNSVYHVDMLKFVQTGPTAFRLDVIETPLIARLGGVVEYADDLFGDGLQDLVTSIGCSNIQISNGSPGQTGYWSYPACAVVGGAWGPTALPNGAPTAGFASNVVLHASMNQGVEALGGSLDEPRLHADQFLPLPPVEAAVPGTSLSLSTPIMPGLLNAATNGVLDFVSWGYYPLSVRTSNAGVPLYEIAQANGYVDRRHYYFTSSMPVVFGMAKNSGNSDIYGFRSSFYGYREAMYNRFGRGFQGFRQITTNSVAHEGDVGREVRVATTYHQKYPLTGRVQTIQTNVPGGNRIAQESDTWICNLANRAACPFGDSLPVPSGATVYTPMLDRKRITRYDPATNLSMGYTDTINAANPSAGSPSGWDAYGNLKNQTTTSGDQGVGGMLSNHVVTTTNTYAPANVSSWWLDKLDQRTTTTSIGYASSHSLPAGATAPARTVTTTYQWNTNRTPLSQTVQPGVANQALTTTWAYPSPSYGLPSTVSVSGSNVAPSPRMTSFSYTKNGTTPAADGYFVLATTNAAGHQTTTERSPRYGQVTKAVDPNQLEEIATYDAFGRLIRQSWQDATGNILLPSRSTSYTRCTGESLSACEGGYGEDANQSWAAWRVTQVQSGYPTWVDWYDALGRNIKHAQRGFNAGTFVATLTEYDNFGTVLLSGTPYVTGGSAYFTGWTHDRLNRPLTKIAPGAELDPVHGNVVTTYSYLGNKTTIKVRGQNVSATCTDTTNLCMDMTRTYDTLGRLLQTVQNNGATANYAVTDYWYDGHGNPVAARDAEGNVIRASYNPVNHRTQVVDPDAGTWNFTYDALGELLTQTDARGVQTSHAYDAIGRLVQRTATNTSALDPSLKVIRDTWYWDPMGTDGGYGLLDYAQRQTGTSVGTLAQVWRQTDRYEATTKRLSERTTAQEGQSDWLTEYYYDPAGREWAVRYPSGLLVKKTYTDWGELRQLSDNTSGQVYWTGTAKDAWGNVTAESYVGSLAGSHQTYASTGQVKRKKWTTGATVLDQHDYAYDSFGNLQSHGRTLGGTTTSEAYQYDTLQRLTQTTRTGLPGAPLEVTYAYTPSGNLSAKSDYSKPAAGSYVYGSNGCGPHGASQVARGTGVSLTDLGTSNVTFQCDANGNVVGGNTLQEGAYDFQNRPWWIRRVGGGVSQFGYDAHGDRYKEISTDGTLSRTATTHGTRFGPSGYERSQLGVAVFERHELGPVTVTKVGSTYTARANLRDRLGSTVGLGGTGSLYQTRAYDAFGKVREGDFGNRPEAILDLLPETLRGFTGHEHVDHVRLIHMNGRMYDPGLGRFLSVDPLVQFPANSQSLNPYSYIMNNPLSGTDPSGYQACTGSHIDRGDGSSCAGQGVKGGGFNSSPLNGKVIRTEGGGIYRASVDSHGVVSFVQVRKENGSTGQGTKPAAQTDGSTDGAAAINGIERDPAQGQLQKAADFGRRFAEAGQDVLNAVNPADPTNLAIGAGFKLGGKAISASGLSMRQLARELGMTDAEIDAAMGLSAARRSGQASEAFHYTFSRYLASIQSHGLRQGTYATRSGALSPLQAQIELALPANRGLPDALVRIDLAGLRQAGYQIPELTRVSSRFRLPGGGYEMQFPYPIPPQFITVVP